MQAFSKTGDFYMGQTIRADRDKKALVLSVRPPGHGHSRAIKVRDIRQLRTVCGGRAGLLLDIDEDGAQADARDYDVDFYLRVLRETYAARLARAFTAEDFDAVFADPEQPTLFERPIGEVRPILTVIGGADVL